MPAKASNEHSGVLCLLLEMLIEHLVGRVLGEDVTKFLLRLGEAKLTPLPIPHVPAREGILGNLVFTS